MDSFIQFLTGGTTELSIEFLCRWLVFLIVIEGVITIGESLTNIKGR